MLPAGSLAVAPLSQGQGHGDVWWEAGSVVGTLLFLEKRASQYPPRGLHTIYSSAGDSREGGALLACSLSGLALGRPQNETIVGREAGEGLGWGQGEKPPALSAGKPSYRRRHRAVGWGLAGWLSLRRSFRSSFLS